MVPMTTSAPTAPVPPTWLPPASFTSGGVHILGHRGARGLVVENTPDAFEVGLGHEIAGIELDVVLSADGVPVVWHDPTLLAEKLGAADKHLAGERVDKFTAEELGKIDVGSALLLDEFPRQEPAKRGITPLRDVLEMLLDHPNRPWVLLEIKSVVDPAGSTAPADVMVNAAIDVLDELAVTRGRAAVHDRIILESFDWAAVAAAAKRDADLALATLLVEPGPRMHSPTIYPGSPWLGPIDLDEHEDTLAAMASLGVKAVAPNYGWVLLSEDPAGWVKRAHDLGLAVVVWTVNDPEHMRMCAAVGIDVIVTDVPDVARAALG